MGKQKRSSAGKKNRLQVDKKGKINTKIEEDVEPTVPRSFVIGKDVPREVNDLMRNVRLMMEPNTATKLKTRKRNVLKDFVAMAGPFGVTHLLAFNKTKAGTNLRIARLPRGPTLTFRVKNYTLIKDIAQTVAKPKSPGMQYKTAPLLVLNNFSGDAVATKLVTRMFQNMFPSIDVSTVELKTLKRVVLLHNDPEEGVVHLRHYEVGVKPAGLSKSVKAVLKTNLPNLSKFNDISDFILGGGDGYESDASDMGDANKVTLPQNVSGAGNIAAKKSSIRLQELGPRMTMNLLKIEEGFCRGDVLFHSYLNKTDAEVKEMTQQRAEERKLKAQRKAQQAKNVKAKEEEKADNRERSYAGQQRKAQLAAQQDAEARGGDGNWNQDVDPEQFNYELDKDVSSDDDAAWYADEVGEKAEAGTFKKRKRDPDEVRVPGGASRHAEALLRKKSDKKKGPKKSKEGEAPNQTQKTTGSTRTAKKPRKGSGLSGPTLKSKGRPGRFGRPQ